ncbi:hypothetical protein ACFPM0_02395 [Pseudonocardia sulfidoxydans]|uniref:hypothetical protein n=1 Tax=Pseudonocardia sulfidoxydans TaxID=54011 RepID=UPI0036115AE7
MSSLPAAPGCAAPGAAEQTGSRPASVAGAVTTAEGPGRGDAASGALSAVPIRSFAT